ncbi:MAG TPA: lipid-binding SYLF domain-containing protein [Candidatus Sulfotelmatobacter sp.]|nr:lipid-binding SYLF domain-containing protein [Candidatus Sulfotelmatobacter sp.]
MKHRTKARWILVAVLSVVIMHVGVARAGTPTAAQINRDAEAALARLYETTPAAARLGKDAVAILVFPSVLKAGFMVGGQFGNGALRQGDKSIGYYNVTAASYGLQAGAQRFGYAMFFMKESALEYLNKSGGFEVGVGPSVVLVDEGMAKTLTSSTARDDIYAFIFGQQGLMAGMGLQGSKITKFTPE